jgi:hypothetical protein
MKDRAKSSHPLLSIIAVVWLTYLLSPSSRYVFLSFTALIAPHSFFGVTASRGLWPLNFSSACEGRTSMYFSEVEA